MRRTLLLIASSALAFVACESEPSPPAVDCTTAVVPTYSTALFATCVSCHNTALTGALRSDAPGDINYNTYETAKAHARDGAAQVNGGLMPPAGKTQPTEAQKQAMYAWALCGTPP